MIIHRHKEDQKKKRHSSEEGSDTTPPNLSPPSPGDHEFGYGQLESSDTLTSKKVTFYLVVILFLLNYMSNGCISLLFFRRMN